MSASRINKNIKNTWRKQIITHNPPSLHNFMSLYCFKRFHAVVIAIRSQAPPPGRVQVRRSQEYSPCFGDDTSSCLTRDTSSPSAP